MTNVRSELNLHSSIRLTIYGSSSNATLTSHTLNRYRDNGHCIHNALSNHMLKQVYMYVHGIMCNLCTIEL